MARIETLNEYDQIVKNWVNNNFESSEDASKKLDNPELPETDGKYNLQAEIETVEGETVTTYTWEQAASGNYLADTNPSGTGSLSLNRKAETTVGTNSVAVGYDTTASGQYSFAEGNITIASNYASHAEGSNTTASSYASHAEGDHTTASDQYAHAEGNYTTASGTASHTEGYKTNADGDYSHAEGYYTLASSNYQHAQGKLNIEDNSGKYAFIIGNGHLDNTAPEGEQEVRSNAMTVDWDGNIVCNNIPEVPDTDGVYNLTASIETENNDQTVTYTWEEASSGGNYLADTNPVGSGSLSMNRKASTTVGTNSVAIGNNTTASGQSSYAEGESTTSSGYASHAEGCATQVVDSAAYGHAEGLQSKVSTNATGSHAEGNGTIVTGVFSHAEGYQSKTSSNAMGAHAEGSLSVAGETYAHAEGNTTVAEGQNSHAEGQLTASSGASSHAEGYQTYSLNSYAHAEGYYTKATGAESHAEGNNTFVGYNAVGAHAEGEYTKAIGEASHAEGNNSRADGYISHAEGYTTISSGRYSHAEGYGYENVVPDTSFTIATGNWSSVDRTIDEKNIQNIVKINSDSSILDNLEEGKYYTGHLDCNEQFYDASNVIFKYIIYYNESTGENENLLIPFGKGFSSDYFTRTYKYIENYQYASYSHSNITTTDYDIYIRGEYIGSGALGDFTHTEGEGTIAYSDNQHVEGKYNLPDTSNTYAHIIGNGSDSENRSNALTVDWDGNIVCNNIPTPPTNAGTYNLSCTVDSTGAVTYSWVSAT